MMVIPCGKNNYNSFKNKNKNLDRPTCGRFCKNAMDKPAMQYFHKQQELPLQDVIARQHQKCFPIGKKQTATYQSYHKKKKIRQ